MHVMHVDPAVAGEPVAATLERLRADPEVEYAEVDQRRYPHALPNDPLFSSQWYMQQSSSPRECRRCGHGLGHDDGQHRIVIADLDTGYASSIPICNGGIGRPAVTGLQLYLGCFCCERR